MIAISYSNKMIKIYFKIPTKVDEIQLTENVNMMQVGNMSKLKSILYCGTESSSIIFIDPYLK